MHVMSFYQSEAADAWVIAASERAESCAKYDIRSLSSVPGPELRAALNSPRWVLHALSQQHCRSMPQQSRRPW